MNLFVPEFTKDMENTAIDALKNETSVMGESDAIILN